ncbi:drs2 neo1 protein [Lecanora helva]
MDGDEHLVPELTNDHSRGNPPSHGGTSPAAHIQQQPQLPAENSALTSTGAATTPEYAPPISPISIEAPSFHSAVSFRSDDSGQRNDEDKHNCRRSQFTLGAVNRSEEKSLRTPSLLIDTGNASEEKQNTIHGTSRSLLNLQRPDAPQSSSAPTTSVKSPASPRNRERGFSLRRSLLSRNVSGQRESNRSIIELQPTSSSAQSLRSVHPLDNGGASKKIAANVVVSPIHDRATDIGEEQVKSAKKVLGSSSLPNYESWWLANRSVHTGLLVRLKAFQEAIRKKILRIQEKPPSKDGRHIRLDINREKPRIDERTGHEYINNTILSTRYSIYNFVPRQLFAQFSKLANFYFLCVSILQMIPGLSTTGTYTTIVPLLFFVTISIVKEGYDDWRRYKLDKAENNKFSLVSHGSGFSTVTSFRDSGSNPDGQAQRWMKTKWQNIRVGDVIKLARDDPVPADIVVLSATGTEGMAYIETMALDGETNLKTKHAPPLLAEKSKTMDGLLESSAHFVVEDPNPNLYNFEGRLSIEGAILPLTNHEIVYRGSVVRNTREVVGIVIYTGEECKIRMNATKNPRIKAPALQAVVNKVVIILVIFVVVLAIFNTAAYQIWKENVEKDSWYLADAAVAFFPILVSFIILFNTMIPLSLYVSLEIVKLFQMLLMNDVDMYDEASNTPMEARTSTINEELGQVNYIFSDKTGTLTNNSMRFRKMSIAGTSWLHDIDLQENVADEAPHRLPSQKERSKGKKAVWRNASSCSAGKRSGDRAADLHNSASSIARHGSSTSQWTLPPVRHLHHSELRTTELVKYIQSRPYTLFAQKASFFLLSIALCHTCTPERKANGDIEYQAASPDELALVSAAQELGYVVIDRQNATISIKSLSLDSDGEACLEIYQILDVLEFSSNRKRMSIIVRMPDRRICVFCKGADSVLLQLFRQSKLAISKAVEVEERANQRQSLEAQVAIRRQSEAKSRKDSMNRKSISLSRPSLGGATRPSMTAHRLQPIRDEVHGWLTEREIDVNISPVENEDIFYSPRPSASYNTRQPSNSVDGRTMLNEDKDELVEETLVADDTAVFERCFQHINDFATEGLRTLLYCYKYIDEDEYNQWKKIYLDASTSLVNRQEMMEKTEAMIERDFELAGATAIEDKLQDGVPQAIDSLRRAKIKLWMLTGDKRETAINVGHSCRLVKDYSTVTIFDQELGDIGQRIAAATLEMNKGLVAHSVIVIDGHTLSHVTASAPLRKLFLSLAIQVDSVICCRASPAQKAYLVSAIRHKVRNAITLAIGDGANDISMIQEAGVGIGITGKEGLQAARTSDYSIAQFRFLTKLLLVHGRWNYIRTCKYTLGTFWKEMLFYLTQALYQRYAGYTGTSLYESWSLSMFNTLFTSLPVIFMGIFEQDVRASTLLAVPELYHSLGHRNGGFNIPKYLAWVAMAASQAVVVFFIMMGLYGQALFTKDNGLYAMGDLTFTACIIIIATKIQIWELQNKTYTCAISMFISIGGWFLWNIILSSTYSNNIIYNVKDGFFDRFGRNPSWWLTLILIVTACWAIEIGVKTIKLSWFPSDADVFRELEKDPIIKRRFEASAALTMASNGSADITNCQDVRSNVHPVRTASEDKEREKEVQEMLNRPRHSRVISGASHEVEIESSSDLRRRQFSDPQVRSPQEQKVSFAVAERVPRDMEDDDDDDDHDEDTTGKGKLRRRSTDVQDMLKRRFGSVRRGVDIV